MGSVYGEGCWLTHLFRRAVGCLFLRSRQCRRCRCLRPVPCSQLRATEAACASFSLTEDHKRAVPTLRGAQSSSDIGEPFVHSMHHPAQDRALRLEHMRAARNIVRRSAQRRGVTKARPAKGIVLLLSRLQRAVHGLERHVYKKRGCCAARDRRRRRWGGYGRRRWSGRRGRRCSSEHATDHACLAVSSCCLVLQVALPVVAERCARCVRHAQTTAIADVLRRHHRARDPEAPVPPQGGVAHRRDGLRRSGSHRCVGIDEVNYRSAEQMS